MIYFQKLFSTQTCLERAVKVRTFYTQVQILFEYFLVNFQNHSKY